MCTTCALLFGNSKRAEQCDCDKNIEATQKRIASMSLSLFKSNFTPEDSVPVHPRLEPDVAPEQAEPASDPD